MKSRIAKGIFITLILFTLTGCWNYRELNTLAVVQAVGVDRTEDGQITLTLQIMKPAGSKQTSSGKTGSDGGGGGGRGVWTLTSTGQTFQDALRNATFESDRRLLGSFVSTLVIGEETARMGIDSLLDHYSRDHENRLTIEIFIARGKAKDVIEARSEQENIPARAMISFVSAASATSKIRTINLNEFLKDLASKTNDPAAPGITTLQKQSEGKEEKFLKLDDTAVFKRDKLVGWLDKRETRGLQWITGKVKSGVIVVKSPGDETKKVGLEITRASSRVKPEIIGGRPVVTVEVKEEGNISEELTYEDFTRPDAMKELDKRQDAAVREEISAALKKAQKELGADIFKFGEAIHRKYPKEWKTLQKEWNTEFPKLEVKVEVETHVRRLYLKFNPEKPE